MQVSVDTHQHQQGTCLQSLLAQANEAAAPGPDMRVPEIENRTTCNKAKAQTQHSEPELSVLDRAALKDVAVLSRDELIQRYGLPRADKAIELAKSQAPTAQQAFAECQREIRAAYAKRGKALQALPNPPMQHSVKDFVHVICTQLELQLNGVNPSANEVLNLAYPNDPKKAERIGESLRVQRVQEAYDSPAIQNHPVEKAMIEHHGKRSMNLRTQTQKFSHSLSAGVVLFEGYDIANKLKAQVKEQGTRISALEQQMECTKNREALADAGATTSAEKVLALYAQGKKQTEIANRLGMNPNTVKSIRRRSKNG
ncbi:hypothetical protein [Dechloromonas denitrificans]|uniref:hypothetical protein n=1 Tax=Dechloromonas denitrificans TaxID=281362 RepID=UPI001CF8B119|nr:hypothetical protein [Dechloromonas denitrificans]UCV04476.1 hypothetical protein KI611_04200 [Dechloromonas denitrificans]